MKSLVLIKSMFFALLSFLLTQPIYSNFNPSPDPNSLSPGLLTIRKGTDFAVFNINSLGKVTEYYLVQVSNWNIDETSLSNATYTEGSDLTFVGKNGIKYKFLVSRPPLQNTAALKSEYVAGIAHYTIKSSDGASLDDIKGIAFSHIGTGEPSAIAPCDGDCMGGGCGTTNCSREIWLSRCEVSCSDGYFACCADLVSGGCHCLSSSCCRK